MHTAIMVAVVLATVLIAALLGGFFWRSRGGFSFVGGGTQATRLVYWGAPWLVFGTLLLLMIWPWQQAIIGGVLCGLFAFCAILNHHGTWYQCVTWVDTAIMCAIQCGRLLAPSLPLLITFCPMRINWWALAIPVAGALSGFGYWANTARFRVPFTIAYGGKVFLSPSDGLAEVNAGMIIGLGCGVAALGTLGVI